MAWRLAATQLADPYLEWARVTGFRGHATAQAPGSRVPVLFQLASGQSLQAVVGTGWIDVPGAHLGTERFATGWALRERLPELCHVVARLELSLPRSSGMIDPAVPPPRPAAAARPLVAVIDRGCAFLNQAFRRDTRGPGRLQTRLLAVWEQGERPGHPLWKRPPGFGYGREITRADIDGLIARAEDGEDERNLYAELGALVMEHGVLPELSHGSFVLDVAGGLPAERAGAAQAKPSAADVAGQADLVFVSVPVPGPGDTTGGGSSAYILDAVHYVLHHAAGRAQPVVINLSIGAQAGAHDGTDMLAQALDDVIASYPGLAITVAAGNGRVQRWNANGEVPPGQNGAALAWRTLPDDNTDSFLELWFDTPSPGPLPAIQVLTPQGEASPSLTPGDASELIDAAGQVVARLSYLSTNAFSTNRHMALLALAPSRHPRASSPPGRWTVKLVHSGKRPIAMDAWVQRDEPPGGAPNAVQSWLEQTFPADSLGIDRGSTLSDLASAARVLVVGACRRADGEVSEYSAGNPLPRGRQVDLLVPADESGSAFGLRATGTRSRTEVRMSGTSVAAPLAARLWLNWAENQSSPTVANFIADRAGLVAGRPRPPATAPQTPRMDIV